MERRILVTHKKEEVQENVSFLIAGKGQWRKSFIKMKEKRQFQGISAYVVNLAAHGDIFQGSWELDHEGTQLCSITQNPWNWNRTTGMPAFINDNGTDDSRD